MALEQALEIVETCKRTPIDSLEMADQCITALAASVDATDENVLTLSQSLETTDQIAIGLGSLAIVAIVSFMVRQGFKLARLQGEMDAYRTDRSAGGP